MPEDLPYMMGVGNVPDILAKIRTAGTPPKFTHEFLKSTLGFSSSSDRGVIKVLKTLHFLAPDGTPLPRYNDFRGESGKSGALAAGMREGWSEVFLADQSANELSTSELTEIFKNVTGKGEAVARKMATTFRALADQADWTVPPSVSQQAVAPDEEKAESRPADVESSASRGITLHQDVHIHLPPSTDVATYTAIFRALREELLD